MIPPEPHEHEHSLGEQGRCSAPQDPGGRLTTRCQLPANGALIGGGP
jgi:hypothetical protein